MIAAMALVGPAGAGDTKKAPLYKTPQAVFEAATRAAEKSDMKGIIATLTDDNRDSFAGLMVVTGAFVKQIGGQFAKTDEDKAKVLKISLILDKHGITPEIIQDALAAAKDLKGKESADVLPVLRKLVQPIKDRPAFVAEVMALTDKGKDGTPFDELKSSKLKDLTITGDVAKGTVTHTTEGKEKTDPIEFRREGGGWRIHIDLNKKK